MQKIFINMKNINCIADKIILKEDAPLGYEEQIKEITGGMIGYIGEWHTHPMGLDFLSGVDQQAVRDLKPLNDKYPIPTFISILSKDKFLPFVF